MQHGRRSSDKDVRGAPARGDASLNKNKIPGVHFSTCGTLPKIKNWRSTLLFPCCVFSYYPNTALLLAFEKNGQQSLQPSGSSEPAPPSGSGGQWDTASPLRLLDFKSLHSVTLRFYVMLLSFFCLFLCMFPLIVRELFYQFQLFILGIPSLAN